MWYYIWYYYTNFVVLTLDVIDLFWSSVFYKIIVRIAPFKFGGNHCFIPFVRSIQPKLSKKSYTCMIVSKYLIPQTGHWLVGWEGNLNFLIQSHVEIQEKKNVLKNGLWPCQIFSIQFCSVSVERN